VNDLDATELDAVLRALGAGDPVDLLAAAIAEHHDAARRWSGSIPARRAYHDHLARALEHLLDAHHAREREPRTTLTERTAP